MMLHSIFAWIAGSERHIFNLRNVQMALILGSVLNKISSVSYVKKKKKYGTDILMNINLCEYLYIFLFLDNHNITFIIRHGKCVLASLWLYV